MVDWKKGTKLPDWSVADLKKMQAMFKQARDEKLWFYTNDEDQGPLWLSPTELARNHGNNKFLWKPSVWELRSPYNLLRELSLRQESIIDEQAAVRIRMIEDGIIGVHDEA